MGRTGRSLLRSLSLRALALLVVLALLPVLLYSIYARIESERRALLLGAVRDAGTAIAAGLAPTLAEVTPAEFSALAGRLAPFSDPRRQITLLFHPAGSAADRAVLPGGERAAGGCRRRSPPSATGSRPSACSTSWRGPAPAARR